MGTAFKGTPAKLKGNLPTVGTKLGDFNLVKNDLSAVTRKDFSGKTKIILTVPSLDTGVCATETKRFNQEAASVPGVEVLVVSRDLPFAQKRFCATEGHANVEAASGHRDAAFDTADGLLIKELRLLARAVLVVDRDGEVRYEQIVPEIGQEPDYKQALAATRNLL